MNKEWWGDDGDRREYLRLHRDRRRLGGLRRGRSAQPIGPLPRAAAGSRRPGPLSVDPRADGLWRASSANPRVNWMYESEPEPELEGRSMYQPRGKVLGGTSSINGMVYMRGNPGRLRRVAPARLHRLGLGQRPAVFQEGGGPGTRRRPVPRRRRTVARLRPAGPLGIGRALDRRRDRGRIARQQRLQRRPAGRRRACSRARPRRAGAGAPRQPICARRATAKT